VKTRILYFETCDQCNEAVLTEQPRYIHLCDGDRKEGITGSLESYLNSGPVGIERIKTRSFIPQLRLRIDANKSTIEVLCEKCYRITERLPIIKGLHMHGTVICPECYQNAGVSLHTILKLAEKDRHTVMIRLSNPFDQDKK